MPETQRGVRSPYIIDLNTTTNYPHQNVTIIGADSDDRAGNSVASGDVNGDGRDDIIIGAPYGDGQGNGKNNCGEVYILYNGSLNVTMDLPSQADMIIYGADDTDLLGVTVATGDINGDKINDIIMGAVQGDGPAEGRGDCGEIYVIFGSGSLPVTKNLASSPPDLLIYGAGIGDSAGSSISMKDINGDNIGDIIIGARYADGPGDIRPGCGEVYLIYGNTILLSPIDLVSQADVTIYGVDSNDFAGSSVGAGKINNDNFNDILIGASGNMGEAYLIYSNNSLPSIIDLTSQANMTIYGKEMNSHLGCSVSSGNVNGDDNDDIIIGANWERDSWNNRVGGVHVIYGNDSLPTIKNLASSPANVTIYGDLSYDGLGDSVLAGDINGDLIDDIIIGAMYADGPSNVRAGCGEVYVINGSGSLPSIIEVRFSQEVVLIYGADKIDYTGKSLSIGKIDNDNTDDIIIGAYCADGINNTKSDCGEVYLILSSGKLKTEFIGLINGDGINNKFCYSKYKSYTFEIKIIEPLNLTDLDTVTLGLDYTGENLQYSWSESTRKFTEIYDPNDYAALNTTSSYRNDGKFTWFIDFNITFNWSYPDNNYHGVQIYSTSDTGLKDWLDLPFNIYRVENHLNFSGSIITIGNYQGTLVEDDWIRGGEQLTWDGLKVVYNCTEDVYPIDSNVTVTIWDSDGDFWNETPNPGENISIITTADMEINPNEIYNINITGIPQNCDNSNVTFKLKIDADNVTFSNPFPSEVQWHTTINPQCGITISDPTTKVDASSIQYRISTDNGTTWKNDWVDLNSQSGDVKNIECIVKPVFKEGSDNIIQWRAEDILGNGYNESELYRIYIDISNVTFFNFTPKFDDIQWNLTVRCNITIFDNLSGVNASSVEFQFSTEGPYKYWSWQSARETQNGNMIKCSVTPIFEEGDDNYLQWRAKDLVGNGPYLSEEYQINVKHNEPSEATLASPGDGTILKTLTPELLWSGTDPDEDSPIYYNVYFSEIEIAVTDLDSSVLLCFKSTETSYKFEMPLSDGATYYWTVIPNDGIIDGTCKSGVWSFRIDTTVEIPIVTLVSPLHNSNVSTQTPSLSWNVDYSNEDIVSYNVFIDLFSSLDNFTANHASSPFTPSEPLIRGATYYWTVIPIAATASGKIQGICESGIWKFTVSHSITNVYGLEIELENTNFIVKQGGYISTNVTVTNTGNTVDIINLDLDEGIIDANIALERLGTPIRLNDSESITLKLEIKTFEEIEVKNYTITITAISNGALAEKQDVTASKILHLQVIEKEAEQTQPTGKESDWALWAALIIIVIIIVLALTFFIYRKRQAEKVPVLKAELEYKPPELVELPGITTPAAGAAAQPELPSTAAQAQPQVAAGVAPTPALTPTPGQAVPQLPQATLSKAQQLNLLRERFLRAEVTEETYNKLRAEIETGGEEAETVEDISVEGEAPPEPPAAAPEIPLSEQPPLATDEGAPEAQAAVPEAPQPNIAPSEEQPPAPEPESQVQQPTEQSQPAQPKLVSKIKSPSANGE